MIVKATEAFKLQGLDLAPLNTESPTFGTTKGTSLSAQGLLIRLHGDLSRQAENGMWYGNYAS